MTDAPSAIANPAALLTAFGYWPSFHDAEVHRLDLDRGTSDAPPSLTAVIHVFDSDGSVDPKGYYRIRTSVLVSLRFVGIEDVELYDFGVQNVLSELRFEAAAGGRSVVSFGQCYGLYGSFAFSSAEILSVRPWPPKTADAPPLPGSSAEPPSNER